jgi:hypothetical protein
MQLSEIPPLKKPPKSLIKKVETTEAKHKGMVVAIDPDSGNYFLGKDTIAAVEKGRKKLPMPYFIVYGSVIPALNKFEGDLNGYETIGKCY